MCSHNQPTQSKTNYPTASLNFNPDSLQVLVCANGPRAWQKFEGKQMGGVRSATTTKGARGRRERFHFFLPCAPVGWKSKERTGFKEISYHSKRCLPRIYHSAVLERISGYNYQTGTFLFIT